MITVPVLKWLWRVAHSAKTRPDVAFACLCQMTDDIAEAH
jgi:hypothetical protein